MAKKITKKAINIMKIDVISQKLEILEHRLTMRMTKGNKASMFLHIKSLKENLEELKNRL
ncbi:MULTISPECIES: hypothetical protein [Weeksellaceae]|uniref:Uncharacterized protein n=1 Tax=Riemerella anatipestifer TaxID=34085 RepID=A0AAP3EWM0_RIEAN|nr:MULTISPECIES: hypothetical protein [Weeksellaceae]AZZ57574.1 hypothetical protein AWB57_00125 [Riemerella anatipestifer]AZZ57748.1 hypothetical protein AWB57_01075 [Riemerella anatipestifer]MBT0552620.1 hypothetical protein [Riemerella anatipestifer]MBT0552858.1 hypothetical protein [Riemerella anatipestifer]MBT0573835.1 hypothetical protein [Riemerella anatipestifer]